jgi:alkylmercury lyase-like protein
LPKPKTDVDPSLGIRRYIFDYFEEHTSAPVLEQIMVEFNTDRSTAFRALQDLESAHHIILVQGTQRILMAWPFSSVASPFKVRITASQKEYFANCAWDAVAFHVMLREEQRIDSYCHHCAEAITVQLKDQKRVSSRPSEKPLVYLSLPAAKWWENILLTCSNNMVFFSSDQHLDDWKKSNPVTGGEALTIEQTLKLSIPFYRDKMKIDYARPSRDQTKAHFKSLGLTGDFWNI